ncbi:MAG: HAD family hydrolase [Actinomycetia bacterium]|nr:HAD family hydrolase [Actinomycetes bacterium]
MIDTLLLDLDGTLIRYTQEAFLGTYLGALAGVFAGLGLDAKASVKALWASTEVMVANDGSASNAQRFWADFAVRLELDAAAVARIEAACEEFYSSGFNVVKSVAEPSEIPQRLVRALAAKGYTLVLATNPLFPECAVETRLAWIGLTPQDFDLVTHYENSSYCKPNLGYYREIFARLGKAPEQCLMVGNSLAEDMCVGELGAETFLVTDYLEDGAGVDLAGLRHGTLVEAEAWLLALPEL